MSGTGKARRAWRDPTPTWLVLAAVGGALSATALVALQIIAWL